ncbi:iron-containing alcohol dehydrogenase family protein [Siminovitchia sediminis]|uniref:Iron-containing alcohol dehydrogenase family protein n=1 Tax=Siminovitchia sediminis TaxID=1274353 RepID=A0ABW4KE70_9BACI
MEKIDDFMNHLPVHVIFGEGKIEQLAEIMEADGLKKAFLVIDKGLEEIIPEIKSAVSKLNVVKYEKEPGEPTISNVEQIAEELKKSNADVVIAIGGGSVIDSAKAARLSITQNQKLSEFIKSDKEYVKPEISLITVPTTAGTGSEVSGGAVITDTTTNVKVGLANPLIRAQYAIVDPVLTYGLPKSITAYTGIDAVAQAIAAVMAKVRTPIGNAVALEAIRLSKESLAAVVKNGKDKNARSNMACASLMAGLAMNISDCTAEHSLGQAIGGMYHLPHGLTVGLVLAETMERERKHIPELMERIADALGEAEDGSKDGSRAVRAIKRIIAEIDIPVLRDVGVKEEDIKTLADRTMEDFFITQSPVPWTRDEVLTAFESAYQLTDRGMKVNV